MLKNLRSINFVFVLLIAAVCMLASCVSPKEITYFQASEGDTAKASSQIVTASYEAIIQKGDILSIKVSSLSPEASSFFNPYEEVVKDVGETSEGYLVNAMGNVEMPLIGQIHLEGLTVEQAKEQIKSKLAGYLKDPTVRIRFKNFRIIVLGEVVRPSVYNIASERITLPEAIGLAGDLTIYGRRNNVLIVREVDGQRTFTEIDLNKRDLFTSPYYYLRSNDIVYIQPGKGKVAAADNFFRIAPLVISTLTMLTLLLTRLN